MKLAGSAESQADAFSAATPEAPYFAVIFTSRRRPVDAGYQRVAERMISLAAERPGFLGVETLSQGETGITISYWRDEDAIQAWRAQVEHRAAQRRGRELWYRHYTVRVCRVERAYSFSASE